MPFTLFSTFYQADAFVVLRLVLRQQYNRTTPHALDHGVSMQRQYLFECRLAIGV